MADAKHRLAYTLTRAARVDLERGDAQRARTRSEEARRIAAVLGRPTESLLATATLLRACRELGDDAEIERLLGELRNAELSGAAQVARGERDALLREWGAGARAAAGGEKGPA